MCACSVCLRNFLSRFLRSNRKRQVEAEVFSLNILRKLFDAMNSISLRNWDYFIEKENRKGDFVFIE